ncbi:MAG: rRNA maturation RNase YbeY [Candidatus Riflebacteria bacterium]|nr:rRNA maturation RNase YbeY [Candidatus Riflebacteria bacterium]
MLLTVDCRTPEFLLHERRLQAVARSFGRALKVPDAAAVGLVLCSVRTLARLGKKHFGQARTTDVIAFPTGFPEIGGLLGEVWIAPDTVARNGLRYGKGLNGEFLFVLAHGLLHLLGADDATPRQREAMFARQEQLLSTCRGGPADPLPRVLERTGSRGPRKQGPPW